MTLTDLLTACYADLGYEAAPSAVVTARLTRYLNEGYHTILSAPGMAALRRITLSFTSVAAQRLYGLPQAFVSIDQITDTTNGHALQRLTPGEIRARDPQAVASGDPIVYADAGYRPVSRDPASTGLWVVSSAGADTTQTALVEGVATKLVGPVTATLNGTTRVAIGTQTDYTSVLRFELNATATGTVSLYDAAAAGNELGKILIGQKTVQYQTIWLWPTASDAFVYAVDGEAVMSDLTQTYDTPLVPVDFQYLLQDYARLREYEYRDDSRVSQAVGQYAARLKTLRWRLTNPPDFRPVCGRFEDRGSSLGSWYPPGRW